MKLGVELLLQHELENLRGKRLGILAHQASLTQEGIHIVDALCSNKSLNVTALFGPEHGLTTHAQDMEAVENSSHKGIPVYSLYGSSLDSLFPSKEMLKNIDVLIVDLQDVGSRYYTYVWTAVLCMKTCAEHGIEVIVCDRPNPLGGINIEGAGIRKGYESFVGLYDVPVRHGLTIGEICQLVKQREKLKCKLHIIKMEGWSRNQLWPQTQVPWVNPSPNMRSFEAALLYPGMCLLEATNLSEGRGTDAPFEKIGAPYLNAQELLAAFFELNLPGITGTSLKFTPSFQKWKNENCFGIQWNITDRNTFQPYLFGVAFVWLTHQLFSKHGFEWRHEPYEFVKHIPAIDLLTGSDEFRKRIGTKDLEEIKAICNPDTNFSDEKNACTLYP